MKMELDYKSIIPGNTTWSLNTATMIKIVQHYMDTVGFKRNHGLTVHNVIADNNGVSPFFKIELKG